VRILPFGHSSKLSRAVVVARRFQWAWAEDGLLPPLELHMLVALKLHLVLVLLLVEGLQDILQLVEARGYLALLGL